MNIILGSENVKELNSKYTVLELDTIRMVNKDNQTITAYCVIEKIPLNEVTMLEKKQELHKNLLTYYRQKQWNYCTDAIGYLLGSWGGELDSFYQDLQQRIAKYKEQDPGENWDGSIEKVSIGH